MAGVFLLGRLECFPCLVAGFGVALILFSLELPNPCIDIKAVMHTMIRLLVSAVVIRICISNIPLVSFLHFVVDTIGNRTVSYNSGLILLVISNHPCATHSANLKLLT